MEHIDKDLLKEFSSLLAKIPGGINPKWFFNALDEISVFAGRSEDVLQLGELVYKISLNLGKIREKLRKKAVVIDEVESFLKTSVMNIVKSFKREERERVVLLLRVGLKLSEMGIPPTYLFNTDLRGISRLAKDDKDFVKIATDLYKKTLELHEEKDLGFRALKDFYLDIFPVLIKSSRSYGDLEEFFYIFGVFYKEVRERGGDYREFIARVSPLLRDRKLEKIADARAKMIEHLQEIFLLREKYNLSPEDFSGIVSEAVKTLRDKDLVENLDWVLKRRVELLKEGRRPTREGLKTEFYHKRHGKA